MGRFDPGEDMDMVGDPANNNRDGAQPADSAPNVGVQFIAPLTSNQGQPTLGRENDMDVEYEIGRSHNRILAPLQGAEISGRRPRVDQSQPGANVCHPSRG